MTTLSILRHALKLNAAVITQQEGQVSYLKQEAKAWKEQDEISFFVATCHDVRKYKAKLSKSVAVQRRIKAEIAAIFRNERIVRKYQLVFGMAPSRQLATSVEQEAMLDTLLAERDTVAEGVVV